MQKEEIKKIKLVHKLLIAIGVVAMGLIIIFFAITSQNTKNTVVINSTRIDIEIATTSQEKEIGLCCRDNLPENAGMLFVYDQPGLHYFWMKDTRIPLDMYWIDDAKKIVHIEHDVQPESYPETFGPSIPAQYILETNAGFARRSGISVGDYAQFALP